MSVGRARHRASLSAGQPLLNAAPLLSPNDSLFVDDVVVPQLQPCAATASIFLYAQGSTVICVHHDTLAVERRFEKHRDPVVMLSVDNVSERGAGRLVVSYDASQTAIVWDLFTGDEITRFASFKPLRVAAWMKNGNIAFGDSEGTVMLFEPSTSEHKAKATINTPITAIAPAADCQTYVIGYENGSTLIASLLPNFTILHTLTIPRKPSAIVGLAWHASSSKQKSDMLAVQCADGDLRVWSIAKPAVADVPKTIRILERGDSLRSGTNWIAWSKNGRILQYSQGETWAWDVRTKHVAYEPIPTVEGVRGVANFGPGATLFTIGPNNSIQQYETNPPVMVKTICHDPKHPPSAQSTPRINTHAIPGAAPPVPIYKSIDPPKNMASLSTIQRATDPTSAADHARQMRSGMGSPISSTSRTDSVSSRGSGYRNRAPSVSAASGTTFSTLSPSTFNRDSTQSPFWPATVSVASSGRRSKGSRLRNEVLNSPEGNIIDLFPFTRARLASLPYAPQSAPLDQATATSEELRRQMLEIVFGWHGDIEPMIRDELKGHPVGSMNAVLLAKWLGDVDVDMMSALPSESISSNDWMLLALSSMSNNGAAGQQMARTFAQRLVSQGDIHTAATVLLGIKDYDEAVEIYVSRNFYMEGILLTCLLFPAEWQRQSFLVRRWGEYVVENSQQHLAIRCFTCTGTDTSLPWATPTQSPFQGTNPSTAPPTLSPPISPPPTELKPSRATVKNASLKLITTFPPTEKSAQFKFPGLKTDDRTPNDRTPTNAPGVTPIAESAISPGGTPSSYLRPQLRARTPSGHGRNRLSSIGETPIDVNPPALPIVRPANLPTPDNSGSDAEMEAAIRARSGEVMIEDAPLTLSSARYNPKEETPVETTPQTALPSSAQRRNLLSNSDVNALNNAQERPGARNGSRDRKPNGLHIQMPSLSQLNLNAIATGSNGASPRSDRRKSSASSLGTGSGSNRYDPRYDGLSPPITGQSWTTSSTKSPSVSGRSVDPYISSLEEAKLHAKQQKTKEKERRQRSRESEKKSRSRTRQREPSESRGRTGQRYIRPPKRSPSSPVPMSPEEAQKYRDSYLPDAAASNCRGSSPEEGPRPTSHARQKAISKNRSTSKMSEHSQRTTVRHHSPESRYEPEPARAGRSRPGSRRQSPNGFLSPIDGRGRSKSRSGGAMVRSPSSPLPMSKQASLYRYENDEVDEESMRTADANRQRLRSRQRSSSRRGTERGSSRARDMVADMPRAPLEDLQYPVVNGFKSKDSPKSSDAERGGSDSTVPKLLRNRSHRSLKQEAAARELEARRESLNMRTLVPGQAKHPVYMRPGMAARSQSDVSTFATSPPSHWRSPTESDYGPTSAVETSMPEHSFSSPQRTTSAGPVPALSPKQGLPATPRAMRHPKHQPVEEVPMIPDIPDQFYATGQPMHEPSRSTSAPVPEPPDMSIPADIPLHPAFQRHLPRSTASKKQPGFHPLNEIGKHRRTGSIENTISPPPLMGSIGEALEGIDESIVIDVPVSSNTPPAVVPELQHLAGGPPPPPPPPFRHDQAHNSLSSGSGVGTINIVMDEGGPSPVEQHPVQHHTGKLTKNKMVISPPMPYMYSPPSVHSPPKEPPHSGNSMRSSHSTGQSTDGAPTSGGGHRRGRSIDHIGNKFGRIADRMRSTSRGRNAGAHSRTREASRDARMSPPQPTGPSPYETRVGVSYF